MAQSVAYETVQAECRRSSCTKATETDASAQSVGKDNWLLKSPDGLAALDRGLADVAAGRVFTRRSYAEYADINIED